MKRLPDTHVQTMKLEAWCTCEDFLYLAHPVLKKRELLTDSWGNKFWGEIWCYGRTKEIL